MILVLYIIGGLGITISAVVGFNSGSFTSFLVSMSGGISTAFIFFALAKILETQAEIVHRLDNQEETLRKSYKNENKICSNCNSTYDDVCNSCPYCGHRDTKGSI